MVRSPRDPDEPDVEREAVGDEGEDSDDGLRAMRSVWLSMRDEDPPAAGLAELMAAARAKATEMKPAPWWRRALDGLRRPPVMALATALVVLGGGVFVATRVKRDAAMPVASTSEGAGAGSSAAPGGTSVGVPGGNVEGARADSNTATSTATADSSRARESNAPADEATGSDPSVAESNKPAPAQAKNESAFVAKEAVPPRKRASSGAGTSSKPRVEQPADTSVSGGLAAPAATQAPVEAPPPPPATEATVDTGKFAVPTKAKPKKPSAKASGAMIDTNAESIYEQCAQAAARGDCAKVKQLVEQISANDKQYVSRLSPKSAISRCLVSP